jgi:hypothetical protein
MLAYSIILQYFVIIKTYEYKAHFITTSLTTTRIVLNNQDPPRKPQTSMLGISFGCGNRFHFNGGFILSLQSTIFFFILLKVRF